MSAQNTEARCIIWKDFHNQLNYYCSTNKRMKVLTGQDLLTHAYITQNVIIKTFPAQIKLNF